MSEQNIALLRDAYSAFGRGDVPGVLGHFDENIEWRETDGMPYAGTHHGPQAVAENVFGPVTQDIDGFSVTPQEFYTGGDEVLVVVRYGGTGHETGKELDLEVVHAWTVRDGKITRFRQFADATVFNAVLAVEATA